MPIPDGFRNDNIPNLHKQEAPTEAENQMRVTWTDLARRNTKFGRELASGGGKRQREVDQEMLQRQREANQKFTESSEDEDDQKPFIPTPGDKDAP